MAELKDYGGSGVPSEAKNSTFEVKFNGNDKKEFDNYSLSLEYYNSLEKEAALWERPIVGFPELIAVK